MGDSTQKHLALYLPSLRGGGAERMMSILAGAFAERGHLVDLVLAKAEGPNLERSHESIRMVDLNSPRVIRSIPALVRYLRTERPDAMLTAMSHANVAAIVARSISGVPTRLIVSERSTLSVSIKNARARRARIVLRLMRYLYPRADGIVAVSEGASNDLSQSIHLPRGRITTIYNPAVTPELLEDSTKALNHPWFGPGKPPVILGVGRLTKAKDFGTLIRAFVMVRERRPVKLIILGEGEERQSLEELAREMGAGSDVSMPGFQENPYVYFRHAAAFVLSSRWEGLPGVLIEAMACGCPVVSTNCPSGPAEILENGKWGALVPVGDSKELARAILNTLESSSPPSVELRAMDFGVGQAAERYLQLLIGHESATGRSAV